VSKEIIDLAIIGSGPNGLYASFVFRNLFPNWNIVVFEKEDFICANIRSYPNVKWHSKMAELKLPSSLNSYIDDHANPLSEEIANYYQEFASEHKLPIRFNHELISLRKDSEVKHQGRLSSSTVLDFVTNGERAEVSCRYVILATGIFSGVRKLPIQNAKIHYGYSLLTKEKHLILIGGGNSAIDFIIHLLPHNSITWVMRGDHWSSIFPTHQDKFDSVYNEYRSKLTIIKNATVSKFCENESMILSNGIELNNFDACHVLIGYSPRNSLSNELAFDFNEECLDLNSDFETSQPNVFAFGSLMATWDTERGVPTPTYVHNGNDAKLKVIIDAISSREVERIFGHTRVLPRGTQIDEVPMLRNLKTLGGYSLKSQTTFLYTKTKLSSVVKLNSRVKHLLKTLFTR
jgi:thioredoxin reductase